MTVPACHSHTAACVRPWWLPPGCPRTWRVGPAARSHRDSDTGHRSAPDCSTTTNHRPQWQFFNFSVILNIFETEQLQIRNWVESRQNKNHRNWVETRQNCFVLSSIVFTLPTRTRQADCVGSVNKLLQFLCVYVTGTNSSIWWLYEYKTSVLAMPTVVEKSTSELLWTTSVHRLHANQSGKLYRSHFFSFGIVHYWASYLHLCALVTNEYDLLLARCSDALQLWR